MRGAPRDFSRRTLPCGFSRRLSAHCTGVRRGRSMTRLLVAQSGGCTAVINSSLVGVVDEARAQDSVEAVYGACFGIRGVLGDDLVDLGRQSRATLARVRRTPSAAL